MKVKLGKKIFLGNIATIVVFMMVSAFIFITMIDLKENTENATFSSEIVQKGNKLLTIILDRESAMRGFLVTGENSYLTPYTDGKQEFNELITELEAAVSNDSNLVNILQNIKSNTTMWDEKAAMVFIEMRESINEYEKLTSTVSKRMTDGIGQIKFDAIKTLMDSYTRSDITNDLMETIMPLETILRNFLDTKTNSYLEAYYTGLEAMEINLVKMNNQKVTDLVNDWLDNYAELQIRDVIASTKYNTLSDLSILLNTNVGKQYMDYIRVLISSFVEKETALSTSRNIIAENKMKFVNLVIIIGAIIASIIGVGVSYIITKSITKQIGGEPDEIADMVKEIADGNLGLEFDNRKAVGIYKSMKDMCVKLIEIIGNTKESTTILGEVGETLSSNAEESSASLVQVSDNLTSINSHFITQSESVEEVTTAMTQITGNIESLNSAIDKQNSQIVESSSSIEEMVSSINSVSENMNKVHDSNVELSSASRSGQIEVDKSNEMIKKVAEESKKLIQTNQIINGIASQTNLLAMNAAIEAAHAGDAGKGFAVVADEIRKLAETTTDQSREISEILKEVLVLIDNIVIGSNDTVESFSQMQDIVDTVTNRSEEVQLAMSEQSEGSRQILESLNNMSQLSEMVKGGADEINNGSSLVLKEILNLKEVTFQSSSRINEITSSTKEINSAVENVMNVSLDNREKVSDIIKQMAHFKLS